MAVALNISTDALVVDSVGAEFKMTPVILADMNDDEVLVQMKYSGICHTDIILQRGLLPFVGFPAIFGHEGAGKVLRVGPTAAKRDPGLKPGATVLLSFNTCGTCSECSSNRPSFCHDHVRANVSCVRLKDGTSPTRLASSPETSVRSQCFGQSSFMRTSVVAARSVVVVPEHLLESNSNATRGGLEDVLAAYAPLGCGLQTGAGTVLNVVKPSAEDIVVIFGMGSVGLAALMAAKYRQVKQLIAVDVVDEKLEAAKRFGATHTLSSRAVSDVPAEIKKLSGGGVHFALDCTGLVPVIESLVECLRPGGTAVSVGVPPPERKVQIDALSFLMENKRFMGVIEGGSLPQKFIPELIELHRRGNFPIDKLCRVYPVKDFDQAITDLRTGKVIKPVIRWD